MSENILENKRIAKNTLVLYLRMVFTMGVSLYTSRIVLDSLGIEDYGIYSLVSGIITMFSFLYGAMSSSTQRFLSFGLGKGNIRELNNIFNTIVKIHALLSLIILLLAETIGLWFLFEKLKIPIDRFNTACWVYQFSVLLTVVNFMSVPYNALIVAHEKMAAFAYVSIIEVLLKLIIAYLIVHISIDRLIFYSLALLFVQFIITSSYVIYARISFTETELHRKFEKKIFAEIFRFISWSFIGNIAATLYSQGLNILINIFYGPVVNAARGISVQVQGAVQQLAVNFQMAINPQITKSYSSGQITDTCSLIFRSARFSFFLLFLVVLPFLLETKFILNLWLVEVPQYTVIFTRLMICVSLVYTFANPCVIANQATGDIKQYQKFVTSVILLILPVSYMALKLGAPAYIVFVIQLLFEVLAQIPRMIVLKKYLGLPIKSYITHIYIPVIIVVFFSSIFPITIHLLMSEGLLRLILVCIVSISTIAICVFRFGVTDGERRMIVSYFHKKIHNYE